MILITGAMGFIGLQVARALAPHDDLLLGYNRTRLSDEQLREVVGQRVWTAKIDVNSPYSVTRALIRHGVSGIVHLAVPALGAMAPAEEALSNISSLVNILDAAHTCEVGRVSLASSVAVYAGLQPGPFSEDRALPVNSPSPTSAMKKAEEILALHYADRTGLDVQALRIGVIYGPRYHTLANLAGRLVHQAVRGKLPADRARPWTSAGMATSLDLCYVNDCADIIAGLHTAKSPQHRIYNVGGGQAATVADLLEATEAAVPGVELPAELRDVEAPSIESPYMDVSRARDEFGLAAKFSLKDGFADYAAWLADHDL